MTHQPHQALPRTHLHLCHLSAAEAIAPAAAMALWLHGPNGAAQETSLRCLLNGEAMRWEDVERMWEDVGKMWEKCGKMCVQVAISLPCLQLKTIQDMAAMRQ